jgi:hypothetical protein
VYIATGHETSDSLRYPFQVGRGAMAELETVLARNATIEERSAEAPSSRYGSGSKA